MPKTIVDRMIGAKYIAGPDNLSDLFRHCETCGCDMHYADSWASDYGLVCDDCAMAEIQAIGERMIERAGS